jgi:hypothetical protein
VSGTTKLALIIARGEEIAYKESWNTGQGDSRGECCGLTYRPAAVLFMSENCSSGTCLEGVNPLFRSRLHVLNKQEGVSALKPFNALSFAQSLATETHLSYSFQRPWRSRF